MAKERVILALNVFVSTALICAWISYRNCHHMLGNSSDTSITTNCPSVTAPIHLTAQQQQQPEVDMSSAEGMFGYLHWTNSTSCLFAVDFGFHVWNGNGVAAPDGHKAVCLDKSVAPVYDKCLVYSFGINNQWAFDDAMETFGCRVYSFDPSMGVGNHKRNKNIHFYNIGLSGADGLHPTNGWNMKTASSIYDMLANSHGSTTPIDVLKMDVEFSEWDAIPQMLRSGFLADKVKQLAVEIHFVPEDPLEIYQQRVRILRELEGAGGFVRFSSRPNPWLLRPISILGGGKREYIGMELAWYNSRFYKTT